MAAYIIATREKTRNAAELAEYKKSVPATFQEHPVVVRAINGRCEVLEGPALEDVVILEFPSYEEAKAWYQSPAYQAARAHGFQGADYRFILTEGTAAH